MAPETTTTPTCSTSDLNLAAHFYRRGLVFVGASLVEDPHRCLITFDDLDSRERELTLEFFQDENMRQFMAARARMLAAVASAREAPTRRCDADDFARELERRAWRTSSP
jgi:hypothetical protein